MMGKETIVRMIENIDGAEKNALKVLDCAINNVATREGVVDVAVAEMLKAMSYDNPIVQTSKKNNDMPELLEWATKQKYRNDELLLQELKKARWEYLKVSTFARVFNLYLRAIDREILMQKYNQHKKSKEITFNGREVSHYEIRKAIDKGIEELQVRMAVEGFDR